jgi:hypothetical protein
MYVVDYHDGNTSVKYIQASEIFVLLTRRCEQHKEFPHITKSACSINAIPVSGAASERNFFTEERVSGAVLAIKNDQQCTYNVTLRRVLATFVAVKKQ